jgi:hypothetical protein
VYVRPVYPLIGVELLLHLKQVTIEMTLQLFIAVINKELLIAIRLEALKAVDIENSDESNFVFRYHPSVLGANGTL